MPSLVDSPVQSPVYFGPAAEFPAQNTQFYGSTTFAVQPGGAASGALLAPQPTVNVLNVLGVTDTTFQGTVTLGITGAGTLTGTTSATATNGVAAFAGVRVTGVGASNLTANVTGRASSTSAPFTMT